MYGDVCVCVCVCVCVSNPEYKKLRINFISFNESYSPFSFICHYKLCDGFWKQKRQFLNQ